MNPSKCSNSLHKSLLFCIMLLLLTLHCRSTFGFTLTRTRIKAGSTGFMISTDSSNQYNNDLYASSGYKKPTVNWYPGHIAKAERQLAETLRAVDVVVEVRDARAPKATSHPQVGEWCAGRPRIVVLTHVDAISKASQTCWHQSYATIGAARWDFQLTAQTRNQAMQARNERFKYNPNSTGTVENVLFCNAKQGQGIPALQRAIFKAGAHIQERRERRGLKGRPLRVGVIGYPNVGKSALINRLLGRRRAKTANTPGVTKSLQWIRVKDSSRQKEFELLDSPGIIPASLVNQEDAALLAACNCIGNKAYDNQAIAAFFMEWCKTLHTMKKETVACPQFRGKCMERYGFDPLETREDGTLPTGEDLLFQVADNKCRGDLEDASRKILQDFRTGRLGPICLQLAPTSEMDDGQTSVQLQQKKSKQQDKEQLELELQVKRQERALNALETAKQQGLKLPPMLVESQGDENDEKKNVDNDQVGKGMFDGW